MHYIYKQSLPQKTINLERVKAEAVLVCSGGEGVDGCVLWAHSGLGAPPSARLLRLVGRSCWTHALALSPSHALQQPDACGAHVNAVLSLKMQATSHAFYASGCSSHGQVPQSWGSSCHMLVTNLCICDF